MLKIENYEVLGWEHAIRGMRNPKNSWDKMDSFMCKEIDDGECHPECGFRSECPVYGTEDFFVVGPNDHKLMMTLASGGPVHAKYRRMITVYLDITAPLYWWKEFDTYKVGTVANSCSTMHKIHAKEFELSDFSTEHLINDEDISWYGAEWFTPLDVLKLTIDTLNGAREKYLETQKKPMKEEAKRAGLMKKYWWQMIQLLPTSYNQKRTVMMNYEVLHNIYESRRHHKLDEWHTLCDWIEGLPYSELITVKDPEYKPVSAPIVHTPETGHPRGYIRTKEDIERTRKLREQGLPEGVAAEDLTTITDYWPDKEKKES